MHGYIVWHFQNADGRLGYGDNRLIEVGQTLTVPGPVTLCRHGLHGSFRVIDALQYAESPVVSLCEIGGGVVFGEDKLAGTYRKCLAIKDVEAVLWEFACRVAERALDNVKRKGWTVSPASYAAIQARRDFQAGKISAKELAQARSAARSAAAESAWSAAESAWSAARSAAAESAWSAARSAAWSAQNDLLEAMILREL